MANSAGQPTLETAQNDKLGKMSEKPQRCLPSLAADCCANLNIQFRNVWFHRFFKPYHGIYHCFMNIRPIFFRVTVATDIYSITSGLYSSIGCDASHLASPVSSGLKFELVCNSKEFLLQIITHNLGINIESIE